MVGLFARQSLFFTMIFNDTWQDESKKRSEARNGYHPIDET